MKKYTIMVNGRAKAQMEFDESTDREAIENQAIEHPEIVAEINGRTIKKR